MLLKSSVVFAALHHALGVAATPWFQNRGTKDLEADVGILRGWNGFNQDNYPKGNVTQVSNVYYPAGSSSTALKMMQTFDPSWNCKECRYHAEAYKRNAYTIGDTGFYGFAFRLSSAWDLSKTGQHYNIAQFIADFTNDPGNSCSDTWLPSMMMWMDGDQLRTRRKGNKMCGPWTPGYDYEDYTVGTITPGEWHRIVIQASWRSDETGYYKVWLDGVKTVEEYNIITTYIDTNKQHHFQFSVGLYANSWHDQGNVLKGDGVRQVWIDQVGIGSEFQDADPAQWS